MKVFKIPMEVVANSLEIPQNFQDSTPNTIENQNQQDPLGITVSCQNPAYKPKNYTENVFASHQESPYSVAIFLRFKYDNVPPVALMEHFYLARRKLD